MNPGNSQPWLNLPAQNLRLSSVLSGPSWPCFPGASSIVAARAVPRNWGWGQVDKGILALKLLLRTGQVISLMYLWAWMEQGESDVVRPPAATPTEFFTLGWTFLSSFPFLSSLTRVTSLGAKCMKSYKQVSNRDFSQKKIKAMLSSGYRRQDTSQDTWNLCPALPLSPSIALGRDRDSSDLSADFLGTQHPQPEPDVSEEFRTQKLPLWFVRADVPKSSLLHMFITLILSLPLPNWNSRGPSPSGLLWC